MIRLSTFSSTAVLFVLATAAVCGAWVASGVFFPPARADYRRGESLASAQLWPEAASAWTAAIDKDPTYTPAYRRLAALFEQQQNLPSAILVWRACVKHVPDARHAWCRLAKDEIAAGLTAAAFRDAERELRQDSACPAANLVAGELLAGTSLQTEALIRLRRSAAAYPDNIDLQLLYARLLAQDFHPVEAAARLRALIRRQSPSPEALYWMAYSLDRISPPSADNPATKEAERVLKQALAMRPQYPEAEGELGSLYESTARPQAAIPYLKHSLAEQPHQATVLFTLANALRQCGRDSERAVVLDQFRQESALEADEKMLQKQYAVSGEVAIALRLAALEHRLQNEAAVRKVLDRVSLDHPGDPAITAFRRSLQAVGSRS